MNVLQNLSEPVLLLDSARARRNIARMYQRARRAGVRLRPHFKTHQSIVVGRWFREAGISAITVSSLAMAEYFASDGWDDILLAFPFHPGMHARVEALTRSISLGITVADPMALAGPRFASRQEVWLKIDVGSRRTGLPAADIEGIREAALAIGQRRDLVLRGLLAHAGHSYLSRSVAEIRAVHEASIERLDAVRNALLPLCGPLELSIGDTPTCSRMESFPGVAELRPGNFVFHDLSQWQIGTCEIDDIAVSMACPVVARHPQRSQLVIHGGAVHFSKDSMQLDGRTVYGIGVSQAGSGTGNVLREDVTLVALSQEHGVVEAPPELIAATRPGDTLRFLPVHSCLTVDAMGRLLSLDGQLIETMRG